MLCKISNIHSVFTLARTLGARLNTNWLVDALLWR